MVDPHTIIRTYLLGNPALVALTDTRIYAGRDMPPPAYKPGDGASVVFKVRGGGRQYEDALLIPSVQFKVYGGDEVKAFACYRALVDALHNGRAASILHAEETGFGQPMEEPDTQWHFVLAFFDVLVRAA